MYETPYRQFCISLMTFEVYLDLPPLWLQRVEEVDYTYCLTPKTSLLALPLISTCSREESMPPQNCMCVSPPCRPSPNASKMEGRAKTHADPLHLQWGESCEPQF